MRKTAKVLVLEDSVCFIKSLNKILSRFGYVLDIANNIDEVANNVSLNYYDIFIVDVCQLKPHEFSILRSIRTQNRNIKILSLSERNQLDDRAKSLEEGANDYLIKPFMSNELIDRLNTLACYRTSLKNTEIQIGNIKVDTSIKKVQCMGSDIELTPSEYKIMEYIVLCKGRVISKSQLEDVLYEEDSNACSNVVEVIISNLRKKIKQYGVDSPIKTRRGFGYYAEI